MIKSRLRRETVYSAPEYWNSKATEYSGRAKSMWPNNHLNEHYHNELTALLDARLPDLRGVRALDVGCGTGRISRLLAERGATVLGIDFASEVIALARAQSPSGNPAYRVQSLFDVDEDGAFDIAVSCASLVIACRNTNDLHKAMLRIRRSLKPGGEVLLVEPIHRGFLHRVLNMDIAKFTRTMKGAGFDVKAVVPLHFWPMRLVLAYLPWPRSLTAGAYRFGQRLMRRLGDCTWGDYKAIHATVRRRRSPAAIEENRNAEA